MDEPNAPSEGWAPVGFAAAAAELEGDAAAARADDAADTGGAGESERAEGEGPKVAWRGVVQSARRIVFGRMAAADPRWKLLPDEERAFDDSWTAALETLKWQIGPWGAAGLTTFGIIVSRGGGPKRAAPRETEAEVVSSSP